jgi:hypothetical protein
MMFNVLKNYHIMIGIPIIEMHQAILPPDPSPKPAVPHMTGAALCLGIWGAATGLPNPKELSSSGGMMMSQGTNIGPGIPHYNIIPPFPPNALLPLIIGLSGSRSLFGASGHSAPQGPIAFACLNVANLNLNCAGPAWPPMPSGLVIVFNTHTVGVTAGDIVGGILHMGMDMLVEFAINRLFGSKAVSGFFDRLAARALAPLLGRLGSGSLASAIASGIGLGRLGTWLGMSAQATVSSLPGTLVSVLGVGTPISYSAPWSPVGGNAYPWQVGSWEDSIHRGTTNAVDDYLRSLEMGDFPMPDENTRTA